MPEAIRLIKEEGYTSYTAAQSKVPRQTLDYRLNKNELKKQDETPTSPNMMKYNWKSIKFMSDAGAPSNKYAEKLQEE